MKSVGGELGRRDEGVALDEGARVLVGVAAALRCDRVGGVALPQNGQPGVEGAALELEHDGGVAEVHGAVHIMFIATGKNRGSLPRDGEGNARREDTRDRRSADLQARLGKR